MDKLNDEKKRPRKQINEPLIKVLESTIKKDTERHFQSYNKTKDNPSKRERKALERLKGRKDIIIKKADKGGSTVIMNSKDYLEEGLRQLNDRTYYEKLDHNPTLEHEEIEKTQLNKLVEEYELSEDIAKKLHPCNSRTPQFYLLPKVHKEGCPGRPVVSSVKCPTEKISAFVDENIRPIVKNLKSYMRDTSGFIRKVKEIGKVPKDSILVTMDVKALYTNIDHNEGLEAMHKALLRNNRRQKPSANALTLLMRLVLILNNFMFNNVNYIQKMGVAIPSAPSFSNIFMANLKTNLCIPRGGFNL